ncbi:MAG: hypothetical protein LBT74_13855 [Acidobacteriota bacterium]|jgi:Tfp pilus assembly protein PilX|nr:hypothetical protein [Acidobacteriota bacterium]
MKTKNESGIALLTVLLILVLLGALLQTFFVNLDSQQKLYYSNQDSENTAFDGAFSALEEATAALADRLANGIVTAGDITAIESSVEGMTVGSGNNKSTITSVEVNPPAGSSVNDLDQQTVSKGQWKGLSARVAPYTIKVTARTTSGAEVTLERLVQIAYIPIFQFGVFSDMDLGFFPGNLFNFGGRVHTNGTLYLSGGNNSSDEGLWMSDYVTAVNGIYGKIKQNGDIYDSHNVHILKQKPALAKNSTYFATFGINDGNRDGSYPGNPPTSQWKTNVAAKFQGPDAGETANFLVADAEALNLATMVAGSESETIAPYEINRRGKIDDSPTMRDQRYYHAASLRILLSDNPGDITSLPDAAGTTPRQLEGSFGSGTGAYEFATSDGSTYYKIGNGAPLIGGYILIQMQTAKDVWTDVTATILGKGVTGVDMTGKCSSSSNAVTNAIIRVQRFSDRSNATGCDAATDGKKLWPNVLFDAREGSNTSGAPSSLTYNGVMHYVELDVKNLCAWLKTQTVVHDTGYVVYFSDRRGSKRVSGKDTAEYAYENVSGKDLNGNGVVENTVPTPNKTIGAYTSTLNPSSPMNSIDGNATTAAEIAKRARPLYFRRALKLVNGASIDLGNRTDVANVPWGLAIASENPVYIHGDYNYKFSGTRPSNDTGNETAETNFKNTLITPGGSVGASVSADAVTILSNNWQDSVSFTSPNNLSARTPNATFYKVAIIAGKNNTWSECAPQTECADWGTDGGIHNFLRMLENWSVTNNVFYRGSIISLYYNQEAVSAFRGGVYAVPKRRFSFETEFLDVNKLPPHTPMVRAIDVLSFTRTFNE